MIRPPLAVLAALIALIAIAVAAVALLGVGGWEDATAQQDGLNADGHATAQIAARRADDGRIEFCVDLGESQSEARERICPRQRRLPFADAPDGRWLVSEWFTIAPQTSLRIRARRLGERLEFGLHLDAGGTRETLLPQRRFLTWEQTPIGRWLLSSAVRLELSAATHEEPTSQSRQAGQGLAAGAGRLQLGAPAPDFRLPPLVGPQRLIALSTVLSEARQAGQATLIVFWASWAPFAEETLTTLRELADARSDLRVVAVNVYEQSAAAARALANRIGEPLLHLADSDGEVALHYRVDGLPELYLLDSRSIYRAVIRGAAPLEEILAALRVHE